MKVLFWNTRNNPKINHVLSELIVENNISVVALAEYEADMQRLIECLSVQGRSMRQYITAGCDRIRIIGVEDEVEAGCQSHYASIQIIKNRDILCCVHLPSRIYSNNEKMREIVIRQIVSDIRSVERDLDTENTIIVGDFNIDPFEGGCIDAALFYGLPVFHEAERRSRVIAGQEFHMFYNPMWNFLGDFEQPYGTYYYAGNRTDNIYWHLFDQVIIRPSLRSRFVDGSLRILTETRSRYLLDNRGHPDKNISDHLPIVFEIVEENHGKES